MFELIAPCHFGMEAVLKKEIIDLGYEIVSVEDGKVYFKGDEEAIARIEEAERDLNDPSKWITAEEMDRRLYERFPWLR